MRRLNDKIFTLKGVIDKKNITGGESKLAHIAGVNQNSSTLQGVNRNLPTLQG
jgi:hypothetical protein